MPQTGAAQPGIDHLTLVAPRQFERPVASISCEAPVSEEIEFFRDCRSDRHTETVYQKKTSFNNFGQEKSGGG